MQINPSEIAPRTSSSITLFLVFKHMQISTSELYYNLFASVLAISLPCSCLDKQICLETLNHLHLFAAYPSVYGRLVVNNQIKEGDIIHQHHELI